MPIICGNTIPTRPSRTIHYQREPLIYAGRNPLSPDGYLSISAAMPITYGNTIRLRLSKPVCYQRESLIYAGEFLQVPVEFSDSQRAGPSLKVIPSGSVYQNRCVANESVGLCRRKFFESRRRRSSLEVIPSGFDYQNRYVADESVDLS